MNTFFVKLFALVAVFLVISACDNSGSNSPAPSGSFQEDIPIGNDSVNNRLNGFVQKGPFSADSEVIIYELDENFDRNGVEHTVRTGVLGGYSFNDLIGTRFVEVSAHGYFYDEVGGSESAAPVSLSAIYDLQINKGNNINILTTIATRRVKFLLSSGVDFEQAVATASREVLKIFGLQDLGYSFGSLDVLSADDDGGLLLGVSSVVMNLLHYNIKEGINLEIDDLIEKISDEISLDGAVSSESLKRSIKVASMDLNIREIRENFKREFGVVSSFDFFVDVDGNGIISKNKLSEFSRVLVGDSSDTIQSMAISNEGRYLLAASYSSVYIYDLIDPSSPVKRGNLFLEGYYGYWDMVFSSDNKTVFATNWNPSLGASGLMSFDISDPDVPIFLDAISTPIGQGPETLTINSDDSAIYMVTEGGGVVLIDISDPSNLILANTFKSGTYFSRSVLSDDDSFLFVLSQDFGLEMVDVTDIYNLQVVDSIDLGGSVGTISMSNENNLLFFTRGEDDKLLVVSQSFSEAGFSESNATQLEDRISYIVKSSGSNLYMLEGSFLNVYQRDSFGYVKKTNSLELSNLSSSFFEMSPLNGYMAVRISTPDGAGFSVYGYDY